MRVSPVFCRTAFKREAEEVALVGEKMGNEIKEGKRMEFL